LDLVILVGDVTNGVGFRQF